MPMRFCLIACLLLTAMPAPAQAPVRVLIVGNSYADGADNHLPGLFAAAGIPLALTSYTPGGRQLSEHLAHAALLQDIRTGRYDVVVLQDHSQSAGRAYLSYMKSGSSNSFSAFAQQRAEANGGSPPAGGKSPPGQPETFWRGACGLAAHVATGSAARIIFFSPWARHADDTAVLPAFPGTNSAERAAAMLACNNAAYEAVRQATGDRAVVARVGDAWALSGQLRPDLKLHADDRSHGNAAGYYLAAAVLFEGITGRSTLGSRYTGALTEADARHLQSVATRIAGRPVTR